MVQSKNNLRNLLNEWNDEKQKNINGNMDNALAATRTKIRNYLRVQTPVVLEHEIGLLHTRNEINVCLGCGAKGVVNDLLQKQRMMVISMNFVAPRQLSSYTDATESSS